MFTIMYMVCTLVSYDTLRIWFRTFGSRALDASKTSHLSIFVITFFEDVSYNKTWRGLRGRIKLSVVQISGPHSLLVLSYTLWKLRFFTSPKTSLRHVFWVKQLYLNLAQSKLSKTYCIRKTNHSNCGSNFKIKAKKLNT